MIEEGGRAVLIQFVMNYVERNLDVTQELFAGRLDGYGQILGIEEAGAHIEYLYQLGELTIANLDEVQRSDNPVLYYRARP